jgi:hypothetical protein
VFAGSSAVRGSVGISSDRSYAMKSIDELFAIVFSPGTGEDEGVPAISRGNVIMPLVGADLTRIEELRKIVIDNGFLDESKLTIRHFKLDKIIPFRGELQ